MPKLTIVSFIRTLIPTLNESNSQDKAFHLLFDPIYDYMYNTDLKSKKISYIMNEKEDIPETIRQAVSNYKIIGLIQKNFEYKVIPILREPLKDDLVYEYDQIVRNDKNISPKKKEELLDTIKDEYDDEKLAEFLTNLFIYTINIPFKKHDEFRRIHYCSTAIDCEEDDDISLVIKRQFDSCMDLDKGTSTKKLITGKLYKLTVKCSFESAVVRNVYMTNVEFEYADVKYKAATSCNNWLSQSKMNNILNAGTSTLTLIFDVLNKDNGTTHIYLIGELDK